MCKVISVVNQKGGVGKTTTTVNVGIGLAREGKKVLLIDADPQGSLTASLGYEEPDDLRITLATIMMDVINEEEINLEDGILHHQENVDLLPANIELSALEVTMGNVMSREMIMKEYIDAIRSRYDYILIDCMPSLGMMTINALVSSDSVLIPVQAAYLPVKGLQQLIKTILTVKKRLNRKLAIEGILLTMVDFRTNYARDIASRVHTTYMIISLIISFYLSALIMRIASTVQNNIWWNYVDQEEYFEMAEGDGRRYLPDVPRPHSYEMKEFDYHVSEICDFLQTFTVLIVSVAGSIIAVFLFYKHKLKCPIEELELASRQVGRNNLDFHITYENEDEMGGLCKEFERMRGQLAENNQQLWKMLEEEKALRAAIAHDIRSPLSVLEGYQEMLSEYLPKKEINMEQALEMVNESKKQIERMDIFVETMRKMSSLDTRELVAEEITSKQVEIDVRAEMNVFRKKFGKLYELECSETEEKFSGDKEVILEVIENLLSNAFRYAKTKVEMEVFLTCSELQIRIKDDGVGFTIDKQKATELFYQQNVKDSLKHSGMGMYISRLYCEKHGGQLLIENEKQSGAVITAVFHRIA